ncbi:unnamed protein product, partial [Mesorhabditis spiculigera]
MKFLFKAGLNRNLTAALFSLCLVDAILMFGAVIFRSIEATGMIVFGTNLMYQHQRALIFVRLVVWSMITSSTLLVIYISLQRCLVVMRPLRYANNLQERSSRTQRRSNPTDSFTSAFSTRIPLGVSAIDFLREIQFRKLLKPYLVPAFIILSSCLLNLPSFLEFGVSDCWDEDHQQPAQHIFYKADDNKLIGTTALINMLTQTVLPAIVISILTVMTEMKVQESLKERRRLFESQHRRQSIVLTEELKEKVSRTVAIFIAVKFLILRTMPVFFDIWELIFGIMPYQDILIIPFRISQFLIILNSATNTLAYFGRQRWLEKLLRLRMIRRQERQTLLHDANKLSEVEIP